MASRVSLLLAAALGGALAMDSAPQVPYVPGCVDAGVLSTASSTLSQYSGAGTLDLAGANADWLTYTCQACNYFGYPSNFENINIQYLTFLDASGNVVTPSGSSTPVVDIGTTSWLGPYYMVNGNCNTAIVGGCSGPFNYYPGLGPNFCSVLFPSTPVVASTPPNSPPPLAVASPPPKSPPPPAKHSPPPAKHAKRSPPPPPPKHKTKGRRLSAHQVGPL